MAKVVTENFRIETSNEFVKSFEDMASNDYYIMGSSYSKNNTISNSQKEIRDFERRVIFGNRITTDDVRYMFNIKPWSTGTVYDSFDDTQDMSTKNFYVTVLDGPINETSYKVFKCIRNNNGAASTQEPSTTQESVNFETTVSDGYIWKYLFSVPPAEYILFGTNTLLPYVKNDLTISNAQQGISDILIEAVPGGAFSSYITSPGDDPSAVTIKQVQTISSNRFQVTVTALNEPKSTVDTYRGLYLRTSDSNVYDIVNSNSPAFAGTDNRDIELTIFVDGISDAAAFINSLLGKQAQLLPKIEISAPNVETGTQAIAYGVVNSQGELVDIKFNTKGSGYFYAEATIIQPGVLTSQALPDSTLRVICSPEGGHGSDPVHELFMSRVSTVTTFISDITTNTPDTNTYTKIGVVKNPLFQVIGTQNIVATSKYRITNLGVGDQQSNWNTAAGTTGVEYVVGSVFVASQPVQTDGGQVMPLPETFDNRERLQIDNQVLTDTAVVDVGFYVSQTNAAGETASGIIHEVKTVDTTGNGTDDSTILYLVDTESTGSKGFEVDAVVPVIIKETKESVSSTYVALINSVTQELYQPYSGELLHFVDFDPITRNNTSKEKVKLIFDF